MLVPFWHSLKTSVASADSPQRTYPFFYIPIMCYTVILLYCIYLVDFYCFIFV